MVSGLSILTNLLLVSAALAVQPSRLAIRLARRRENRQSQPSYRVESSNADSMTTYTGNWAGAEWLDQPGTFTTNTGSFTVPLPQGNDGGASAWVGIDGADCQNAILQTGVDITISDGEPAYYAWYEWFPAYAQDFSGITISDGDNIKLTVTAYSSTSGQAVIENLSNGQTVTQDLASSYALCQQDAEWIVEDYVDKGSLIPFVNFGSVTFSDAYASDVDGVLYDPAGATLVDIKQDGQKLTKTYATGSSVTIEYGSYS